MPGAHPRMEREQTETPSLPGEAGHLLQGKQKVKIQIPMRKVLPWEMEEEQVAHWRSLERRGMKRDWPHQTGSPTCHFLQEAVRHRRW